MTPAEKSLASRIGAHTSWANTPNRNARMAPARAGFMAKFERQVDPDGVMDPADRAKAAESAMKAHMSQLRLIRMAKSTAR
jgi:hypothetical protein